MLLDNRKKYIKQKNTGLFMMHSWPLQAKNKKAVCCGIIYLIWAGNGMFLP